MLAFAFKYVGFNIDVGYWREIFYLEAEIKVARQSEAEAFERSLGIELRALWNSLTYTTLKPPESSKSKSRKPVPEKNEKIFIFLFIRKREELPSRQTGDQTFSDYKEVP